MDLGTTSSVRGFEDHLVTAATWVLAAALLWLVLLLATVLVEAASAGRWQPSRWTGAPLAWRRTLLALAVAALPAVGITPAHADPSGRASGATAVEGLPLPSRPAGGLAADQPASVTVRSGDSLWAIARRQVPGADDATLVRFVEHLHESNRAVIGADPDLIVPGQRLVLPSPPLPEEPR